MKLTMLSNTVIAIISLLFSESVLSGVINELPPDLFNQDVNHYQSSLKSNFPEKTAINSEFISNEYEANISLASSSNISISFMDEGAGYRNSLGYFSYNSHSFSNLKKKDIDTNHSGVIDFNELNSIDGVFADLIFPNSSFINKGGKLTAGDTTFLNNGEVFQAGTHIGFFLVQNAWNGQTVRGVGNDQSRQIFYTMEFLNPETPQQAMMNDSSIPDEAVHVAMMYEQDSIFFGFEDLNRMDRFSNDWNLISDNDFNDAIYKINLSNPMALRNNDIAGISAVPTPPSFLLMLTGLGLLALNWKLKTSNKKIIKEIIYA